MNEKPKNSLPVTALLAANIISLVGNVFHCHIDHYTQYGAHPCDERNEQKGWSVSY